MFASQRVLNRIYYSGTYLTKSPRVGSAQNHFQLAQSCTPVYGLLFTVDLWAVAEYDICHTAHESTVNKARKLVDSCKTVPTGSGFATPLKGYSFYSVCESTPLWSRLGLSGELEMLMTDSGGRSATNSSDGCMQGKEDDAQWWRRSRDFRDAASYTRKGARCVWWWSSEGWNGHRSEVVMGAVRHRCQCFGGLASSDDKRLHQTPSRQLLSDSLREGRVVQKIFKS